MTMNFYENAMMPRACFLMIHERCTCNVMHKVYELKDMLFMKKHAQRFMKNVYEFMSSMMLCL
jgi:hypothetical protein